MFDGPESHRPRHDHFSGVKRRLFKEYSCRILFLVFFFFFGAAHQSYKDLEYAIECWRTRSGLAVDFVLGSREIAFKVKGTSRVDTPELQSLLTFTHEFSPTASPHPLQ